MKKTMSILAIAGFILALAPAAQAGIIDPVTATASSDFNGSESWGRPTANAVNGVGMTGEGATGKHDDTDYTTGWQTGQVSAPWFIVDLGGTYDVGKMYVWNGAPPEPTWGVQTVDIYYATTDSGLNVNNSEAAFDTEGWSLWNSGSTAFAQHAGTGSYGPTNTFDLDVTARYIALSVTAAYGGINNSSIAELQFVPEPATMSLLAIGGIALLRRRRRA